MTGNTHQKDGQEKRRRPTLGGNGFAGTDLSPLAHADLDSLCRSVMELAKAAPKLPQRIKLQSGQMTVELEWPEPGVNGTATATASCGGTGGPPETVVLAPDAVPTGAVQTTHTAQAAQATQNTQAQTTQAQTAQAQSTQAVRAGEPPEAARTPQDQDRLRYLLAPTVGTFYHAPEPGSPPFVSVGDVVRRGQPVGILEVMKMMSPIEADVAGRIVEIVAPDGQPVEFQQRLIAVEPLSEPEA